MSNVRGFVVSVVGLTGLACAGIGGEPAALERDAAPVSAARSVVRPFELRPEGAGLSVDLDGDGAREQVVLGDHQVVIEGRGAFPFDATVEGEVRAEVIDLDPTQPGEELVVAHDDGHRAVWQVFAWSSGVRESRLRVSPGAEPVVEDNTLTVEHDDCGERTVTVFALAQGELAVVEEQRQVSDSACSG
ncbi:MAG: hypothetical protein ABMA64_23425 [Myxococcota bacterium]